MGKKYSDETIIKLVDMYCNSRYHLTWTEIARNNQISESTIKKRMYELIESEILPLSILDKIEERTCQNIGFYNSRLTFEEVAKRVSVKVKYFEEKRSELETKIKVKKDYEIYIHNLKAELAYLEYTLTSFEDGYISEEDEFPLTQQEVEKRIEKLREMLK